MEKQKQKLEEKDKEILCLKKETKELSDIVHDFQLRWKILRIDN